MINHFPAKPGSHMHVVAEIFLISHVSLRDQVFKGLCDFKGWSPSH